MIVLFAIAMVCFFALFGMMVVLLRQAKIEGAAERQRDFEQRRSQRGRTSDTHAAFGVSQAGLDLSLSNLVPSKQPDWRFMLRDTTRTSGASNRSARKGPKPFRYGTNRPDREYASKDLGDLTDPQTSQTNVARRA